MKQLRELAITNAGLWYSHYLSCDAHPRRISPKSYRAGVKAGWVSGLAIGFVFGMMTIIAVCMTG